MATRSTIGILNEDKTVTAIYCHFDGYLSGVGEILFNHYDNEERIRELLSLGSISILGKHIEPLSDFEKTTKFAGFKNGESVYNITYGKHSFDNAHDDTTLAYTRDRGDDFWVNNHKNENDFYENGEEFNYLYKEGKWFVDGKELTKEMIEKDK